MPRATFSLIHLSSCGKILFFVVFVLLSTSSVAHGAQTGKAVPLRWANTSVVRSYSIAAPAFSNPTPTPAVEHHQRPAQVESAAPEQLPSSNAAGCVHLVGSGSFIRIAIVPAGFDGANADDVADFKRLAQVIADGFAATDPYASGLSRFSISRVDDYRGATIDPRSDQVWYNSALIAAAAACDYNQIIVIAHNSGWAGGAPGFYSVVGSGTPATCNPVTCTGVDCPFTRSCSWDENIAYTALHESGHSIAGLRHTCDPARQQVEIRQLNAMELLAPYITNSALHDDPINCGIAFGGNEHVPCTEWNNQRHRGWGLPADPEFGCYAVCDDRPQWYRAWNAVPNIMCIDMALENGFTPVERKLLGDKMGLAAGPDLIAAPVIPASKQGTSIGNTLYADSRTFFDWEFVNQGIRDVPSGFYVDFWVDDTRYAHYQMWGLVVGEVRGFTDWAETVITPGEHTISIIVDPNNDVAESDETNNEWRQQFTWEPITGWTGEYYANPDLDGNPWMTRDDPAIDFEWLAEDSPDAEIPADGFSVRWTRSQYFDAGPYLFAVRYDDGVRFYVDGILIHDNWCADCGRSDLVQLDLTEGMHDLRLEMFDLAGAGAAVLTWQAFPAVQFRETRITAGEEANAAVITLSLSKPWLYPVAVDYATRDGTATAGSDYATTSGVLEFSPNQTTATFAVPLVDDGLDEVDETVNITLGNPISAVLGIDSAIVLTIIDNEHLLTVTKVGTGGGLIVGTPPGIVCGADCMEVMQSGDTVRLTAASAPSSSFTGWRGACGGQDVCSLVIRAPQQVEAVFAAQTKPVIEVGSNPTASQAVEMTATLGMSNFDVCTWDFGDGSTSECNLPMTTARADTPQDIVVRALHVFAEPGQYAVAIRASNLAGEFASTQTITVAAKPSPIYMPYINR